MQVSQFDFKHGFDSHYILRNIYHLNKEKMEWSSSKKFAGWEWYGDGDG